MNRLCAMFSLVRKFAHCVSLLQSTEVFFGISRNLNARYECLEVGGTAELECERRDVPTRPLDYVDVVKHFVEPLNLS